MDLSRELERWGGDKRVDDERRRKVEEIDKIDKLAEEIEKDKRKNVVIAGLSRKTDENAKKKCE